MLEPFGQTLGTLGGLVLEPGRHCAGDREELGLDLAAEAPGSALEQAIEAGDRALEPRHRVALAAFEPGTEIDQLTHRLRIVDRGYDTSSEPRRVPSGRVGEMVGSGRYVVRRVVLALAVATLVVVLPAQAASAGGNWLGFRSEEPVAGKRNLGTWAIMHVGQEVVAHTGIYVMNPDRMDRLETKGPFYAWLSPGDAYLDDTNLPADAIRLAPFTIAFDGSNGVPVRARFTVPNVPSGEYEVVVCNDPCTLSGFGEFVQGWITITRTAEEARLMNLARERKWNLRDAKKEARQLEGDLGSLEADLDAAQGEARAAALDLRSTDRTIELLRSENDALRARLAAAETDGIPVWAIVALAIAILGAAFLVRRRRDPAFEIPDTVPDDLVEGDRVGV